MSLRINHNMSGYNAHRNVVNNSNAQGKTMEKLSSGLTINRAADGPAALHILAVMIVLLLVVFSGTTILAQDSTIKYPSWMWAEGAVGDWHKARLAEFEKAYPDFTVQTTQIAAGDYETTIITQLAAGDAPDVLPVFTNMIPALVKAGLLEPLDECLARTSFADRLLPSVSVAVYDGQTYGVPLTMSPRSLIYNQELLDKAGVELPTTIEEFYDTAKTVQKNTDADWGYAFHTDSANVLQSYIETMNWSLGFGSDWSQEDGTITANTSENVEALTWLQRFLDDGISPQGLHVTTARNLFLEGEVAFMFEGPWLMTMVKSKNADLYQNVGYTTLPTPTHAAITGGAFYVIPVEAQNKDAACDYLEIINSTDAQRSWLEDLVQIPGTVVEPTEAFLDENPWVPNMVEVSAQYPGGLGYAPPGYRVEAGEFRQIVIDHVAQIWAGSKSVEEALDELQVALKEWAADL